MVVEVVDSIPVIRHMKYISIPVILATGVIIIITTDHNKIPGHLGLIPGHLDTWPNPRETLDGW